MTSICWSDIGRPLSVHTSFINTINPNIGEATTAVMTIQEAMNWNLKRNLIKGDSKLVVVHEISQPKYTTVLDDVVYHKKSIEYLLHSFDE